MLVGYRYKNRRSKLEFINRSLFMQEICNQLSAVDLHFLTKKTYNKHIGKKENSNT